MARTKALECENCGRADVRLRGDLCPDCEPDVLLLRAVRTVAPDATPEQVAEWLRAGQAVERLGEHSAEPFGVSHDICEGWTVLCRGKLAGRAFTLPAAVDAALGNRGDA